MNKYIFYALLSVMVFLLVGAILSGIAWGLVGLQMAIVCMGLFLALSVMFILVAGTVVVILYVVRVPAHKLSLKRESRSLALPPVSSMMLQQQNCDEADMELLGDKEYNVLGDADGNNGKSVVDRFIERRRKKDEKK